MALWQMLSRWGWFNGTSNQATTSAGPHSTSGAAVTHSYHGNNSDLATHGGPDGWSGFTPSMGTSMQELNRRLAAYVEQVHSLEEANRKLEQQIEDHLSRQSPRELRELRPHLQAMDLLHRQIAEGQMEYADVKLQLVAAQLDVYDLDLKCAKEHQCVELMEADLQDLLLIEERLKEHWLPDLQLQLTSYTQEMEALQEQHQEDVKDLLARVSGNVVVNMQCTSSSDLNQQMLGLRDQCTTVILQNQKRNENWFNTQVSMLSSQEGAVPELGSEVSQSAEMKELRRTLLSLENDMGKLQAQMVLLKDSEVKMHEVYTHQLTALQQRADSLSKQLGLVLEAVEKKTTDFQLLLETKNQLEMVIEDYRRLLDNHGEKVPAASSSATVIATPPGATRSYDTLSSRDSMMNETGKQVARVEARGHTQVQTIKNESRAESNLIPVADKSQAIERKLPTAKISIATKEVLSTRTERSPLLSADGGVKSDSLVTSIGSQRQCDTGEKTTSIDVGGTKTGTMISITSDSQRSVAGKELNSKDKVSCTTAGSKVIQCMDKEVGVQDKDPAPVISVTEKSHAIPESQTTKVMESVQQGAISAHPDLTQSHIPVNGQERETELVIPLVGKDISLEGKGETLSNSDDGKSIEQGTFEIPTAQSTLHLSSQVEYHSLDGPLKTVADAAEAGKTEKGWQTLQEAHVGTVGFIKGAELTEAAFPIDKKESQKQQGVEQMMLQDKSCLEASVRQKSLDFSHDDVGVNEDNYTTLQANVSPDHASNMVSEGISGNDLMQHPEHSIKSDCHPVSEGSRSLEVAFSSNEVQFNEPGDQEVKTEKDTTVMEREVGESREEQERRGSSSSSLLVLGVMDFEDTLEITEYEDDATLEIPEFDDEAAEKPAASPEPQGWSYNTKGIHVLDLVEPDQLFNSEGELGLSPVDSDRAFFSPVGMEELSCLQEEERWYTPVQEMLLAPVDEETCLSERELTVSPAEEEACMSMTEAMSYVRPVQKYVLSTKEHPVEFREGHVLSDRAVEVTSCEGNVESVTVESFGGHSASGVKLSNTDIDSGLASSKSSVALSADDPDLTGVRESLLISETGHKKSSIGELDEVFSLGGSAGRSSFDKTGEVLIIAASCSKPSIGDEGIDLGDSHKQNEEAREEALSSTGSLVKSNDGHKEGQYGSKSDTEDISGPARKYTRTSGGDRKDITIGTEGTNRKSVDGGRDENVIKNSNMGVWNKSAAGVGAELTSKGHVFANSTRNITGLITPRFGGMPDKAIADRSGVSVSPVTSVTGVMRAEDAKQRSSSLVSAVIPQGSMTTSLGGQALDSAVRFRSVGDNITTNVNVASGSGDASSGGMGRSPATVFSGTPYRSAAGSAAVLSSAGTGPSGAVVNTGTRFGSMASNTVPSMTNRFSTIEHSKTGMPGTATAQYGSTATARPSAYRTGGTLSPTHGSTPSSTGSGEWQAYGGGSLRVSGSSFASNQTSPVPRSGGSGEWKGYGTSSGRMSSGGSGGRLTCGAPSTGRMSSSPAGRSMISPPGSVRLGSAGSGEWRPVYSSSTGRMSGGGGPARALSPSSTGKGSFSSSSGGRLSGGSYGGSGGRISGGGSEKRISSAGSWGGGMGGTAYSGTGAARASSTGGRAMSSSEKPARSTGSGSGKKKDRISVCKMAVMSIMAAGRGKKKEKEKTSKSQPQNPASSSPRVQRWVTTGKGDLGEDDPDLDDIMRL